MHKLESVRGIEIETDDSIPIRRPDLALINKNI